MFVQIKLPKLYKDHDGLITHHDGSWDEETRESGSIKSKIIFAYFQAGGIPFCIMFLLGKVSHKITIFGHHY